MDKIICESRLFNSLFKCPLCNERIHSATVINECLHRFCKLCITNYFENDHNKICPVCQIVLTNPLQTLRSDLTYQRLLYKIFHREIACKSSLRTSDESTSIFVYLEYWDISSELFPIDSSIGLLKCYLECQASTPLASIEKFLRIKHSIPSNLKIDFFYQSFLLNIENECLIDIFYSFDRTIQNSSLDIRFIVSSYGYKVLLKRLQHSKQSIPSEVDITPPTLKMKICRSESSWFIPQSTLPDLINSCEKQIISKKKFKPSRRRIRFIPTMVNVPPSIFDYLSNNIDKKTICQVPPYIPENSLFDNTPLDLSLK